MILWWIVEWIEPFLERNRFHSIVTVGSLEDVRVVSTNEVKS